MPCGECDRLRKENRELREELAEYQIPDDTLNETKILRWMRKPASPQTVSLCVALARAKGRILTSDDLAREMGAHTTMDPMNCVRVHVTRARRCFEYRGMDESIFNQYGVGFYMDPSVGREILAAGRP